MTVAAGARRLVIVAACAMLTATSFAACSGGADDSGGSDAVGEATFRHSTSAPADTETPQSPPTTSITPRPETPVGSIPQVLVGAWCGGSDASGHDTWIFAADGNFTANEQGPLSGVARVRNGSTLVLHTNEIGVHERAIAMDQDTPIGDILFLDGYSYVRGEC